MALQPSTQWNIDIHNKEQNVSPPKKLAVQERLESYSKPPSPLSKENLDLKQLQADEARSKMQVSKKEKVEKKEKEVGERRRRLSGEFEKKIETLKEVTAKKEEKAAQAVKDAEARRVTALAARNAKVIESGKKAVETLGEKTRTLHEKKTEVEEKAVMAVKAKEADKVSNLAAYNAKVIESGAGALKGMENKVEALKTEYSVKEEKAEVNHKSLEEAKVACVASYNNLVKEKANLAEALKREKAAWCHATSERRMQVAADAKENEVLSVVVQAASHNDMVKSRSDLVSATKTIQREHLRNETEYKVKSAAYNREEIMMQKQMDLARKNQEVSERGSAVKSFREKKEHDDKVENDAKMMGSSVRREVILQDKVMKAKILASPNRSPQVSPGKGDQEGGLHNQVSMESIQQKLEDATIRRSAIIEQKVNKALTFSSPAPKGKGSPAKVEGVGSPVPTLDSINLKMEDAAARRETLLLQKAESAGMAVQKAKEVASAVKASSPNGKSKGSMNTIGADGNEVEGKKLHCDEEGLEPGHPVREIEEDTDGVSVNDVSLDMKLNEESPCNESQNEDLGGGNCTAA